MAPETQNRGTQGSVLPNHYGNSSLQAFYRSGRTGIEGSAGLPNSGGKMERHLRRFAIANQHPPHPVSEHAVVAGSQVVLSNGKSIELEVTVGVGVRCVRMQAVGSLDDHRGVGNGVSVGVHQSPGERAHRLARASCRRDHHDRSQEENGSQAPHDGPFCVGFNCNSTSVCLPTFTSIMCFHSLTSPLCVARTS